MSMESLEKLLSEQATETDFVPMEGADNQATFERKSPTALQVDKWGLRRAERLAEAEWNQTEEPFDEYTLADTHSACFEPRPMLDENPEDVVRSQWFKHLLETPEFKRLHASTCLDHGLSEIGCKVLADQWVEYSQEVTDDEREQIESEEPPCGGLRGPGQGDIPIETEIKRIRSIDKAINKASQDVQDAKDLSCGLGLGEGQQLDGTQLQKLFMKVRHNEHLRRICDWAGRFKRVAVSHQRRKSVHGMDDLVGVETGGDIDRLLPSELASLCIPEMELDTLRRIVERQAMVRQYRGIEHVAKGPIVVCVDESGSMNGDAIQRAKAIALTMGWIARSQGRWIAFVGFSAGDEGTRIAFPPGQWDQDKLIDWLMHFYAGGTTLDVCLSTLPFRYWDELGCPDGDTDIVVITDACVGADEGMLERFAAWKVEHKAKCFGIVIDEPPGVLERFCDRTWRVSKLDVDSDAVSGIFSI